MSKAITSALSPSVLERSTERRSRTSPKGTRRKRPRSASAFTTRTGVCALALDRQRWNVSLKSNSAAAVYRCLSLCVGKTSYKIFLRILYQQTRLTLIINFVQPNSISKALIAIRFNIFQFLSISTFFCICFVIEMFLHYFKWPI